MRIPYGYTFSEETGQIVVSQQHANTVKAIYDFYLRGKSLGGIADALKTQNIPSPTGNPLWTRAAIDKILSNGRYVPSIITEAQFWQAQIERERRTNTDDNGRKAARYNSQNVLSGLLVCGDCGSSYRRITRSSGEIVWRCANKVENGKKAECSNMMTMSDHEIKKLVCGQLNTDIFNENVVRSIVDTITVSKSGAALRLKNSQSFCL